VLECTVRHDIKSVAFCCISTGEFHFPNDAAAAVAVNTVMEYLQENGDKFERIIFNVFKDRDKELYEEQFAQY
jgi:Predicted phosphatase homologous to the C-terminal domain of histone macroH2A1